MLAILIMGAGWFMARQVESIRRDWVSAERLRNMQVLNRAKQALIGYVAAQAIKTGENNPGALPCPEAPGSFNATNGTDGKMNSAGCSLPAVGRFPWRTIGTEKFVDAAGEPLWYVVSPGWAVTCIGCNTNINSNSLGQLSVDGVAGTDSDTVVALIIAPGLPMNVPASANCTAYTQARPTTGTPDIRNYFECQNAITSTTSYVTTGPSQSFNDTLVKVTKADIVPGIEAAIANRIYREIVPALKTVYYPGAPNTSWGLTGSSVLYPFPATFADPSASPMQGASSTCSGGTCRGLLPVNHAETYPGSGIACTVGASDPTCSPSFVAWSTTGITVSKTAGTATFNPSVDCSLTSATLLSCRIPYSYTSCFTLFNQLCTASMSVSITDTVNNIGMAMRQLSSSWTSNVTNLTSPALGSLVMNAAGGVPLTLSGSLPSVSCNATTLVFFIFYTCVPSNTVTVTASISMFLDHTILDSRTSSSTGWFLRNKWNELTYYAVANNYSPAVMPTQPSCTTGASCLTVTNVTPTGGQHAIMILAGRAIDGSTRPSGTLSNYLEFGNATGSFEKQPVSTVVAAALKRPFNDRIVVIDSN
ncbi:MAG TPA: hypothetical protein VEU32_21135 [Burkholderiales bacterium]|nr:hypothetical protein [Burkholderiales bacterium]